MEVAEHSSSNTSFGARHQFLCGVPFLVVWVFGADRQKIPSHLLLYFYFPLTDEVISSCANSDSRQAIELITVPTMNGFWKEMERRTSASSYGYELGDEAKPEHIDLKKPADPHEQEIGDNVFVKRSNGTWGFAILTEKGTDGGGNFYTYQIGRNHKFKTLCEDQLSECVKAVEAERQRRKFGTDYSLSYDSGYINTEYGFSEKYELGDEAKSEHIDHTKTIHYAAYEARKLRVGDNCFVKRSNGTWCFAVLTEKATDRDGRFYTYQIDRNNKFKTLHEDLLGESVRVVENQTSSYPKLDVDQSLSCESYTDRVFQSNQKQLREGMINNYSDDKENICHSNKPDRHVADEDESRQSRSSKKAAPSKHHKVKRRRTTTGSKLLSLPPAALNAIEEQHEEDFSILEDLKNTEALIKEEPSNNFNEKEWRGKSDAEICFMPSGEEKNSTSTAIVPYSQDPTQLIPNSHEEKSSPSEQNHSSHPKKRRRIVFGKFFARKFRKKEASDEPQCNTVNSTNDIGEVADATSQSEYEKIKPPEKPPKTVAQTTSSQYRYHYSTKPTTYAAAPAGLVPNYNMNQHVHYISAPKIAQAYRDYAKACPQGYYLYNPITRNAQYVNQWMPNYQPVPHFCHGMQSGMPSLQNTQNNVIYVGKNGVHAATGVQIYPGKNITRIDL